MVQRRQRERSLFEVLLPDGHKLWPDWLRKIDTLLEDDAVIEVVAHALEQRWPQSRRRGRLGGLADRRRLDASIAQPYLAHGAPVHPPIDEGPGAALASIPMKFLGIAVDAE